MKKKYKEKTGAVRGRVQALDPKTGKWIIDVDNKKFKSKI